MELILIAVGWYTIKNVKGASVMTAVAKARRIQAVKLADALNAIEGVPVSDYAKTLSQCWANGELAGEQMKAALMAFHWKMAAAHFPQP